MQDSNVEESTFQLVLDQLEELAVMLVEEIRARPGVALAIIAGIVGALVGSRIARRRGRTRVAAPLRRARNVGAAAELAGLVMRLLQNPIVRALVLAALQRQLRRRLAR